MENDKSAYHHEDRCRISTIDDFEAKIFSLNPDDKIYQLMIRYIENRETSSDIKVSKDRIKYEKIKGVLAV